MFDSRRNQDFKNESAESKIQLMVDEVLMGKSLAFTRRMATLQ